MIYTQDYTWNPNAIIINSVVYQATHADVDNITRKAVITIQCNDTGRHPSKVYNIIRRGKLDQHNQAIIQIDNTRVIFGFNSGGLYIFNKG